MKRDTVNRSMVVHPSSVSRSNVSRIEVDRVGDTCRVTFVGDAECDADGKVTLSVWGNGTIRKMLSAVEYVQKSTRNCGPKL